ncbi:MAG TPA: M14 family metallopeptidase [Chitinophagaceae bacterium]|jgi:hypothetical protein|nr:M14 family metallopeptidase [Chitinophagaceae bacterium]HMU58192.1 M14 family metallopeptidase [Chitinophagaceae bacterium]
MKKTVFYLLFTMSLFQSSFAQNLTTLFEQSGGTKTPTYFEIVDWWKRLDEKSGKVKVLTMGETDAGFPLHLIVVGNNGDYNFENIRKNNKRVILINNGIHPGEPDGIDASMLLVRDIVTNKYKIPDNIVLAIIPVYNIGGCLNRSSNFRVDQNGPEEFGSRGNSQNLDLNRDFIKCDSKEARSFTEIFHLTAPDVFIDNHVSNGADYQHVMTLAATQHNKLGGVMGDYLDKTFEPAVYEAMKKKGYDLVPYVNVWNDTPDKGWSAFWDTPRYASGYAALWHCFSFVNETHMLKPYHQRVKATYSMMESFIEFTAKNSEKIKSLREETVQAVKTAPQFALSWTLDKSQYRQILYKGFEAGYKLSEVSGLPRLFYDKSKPYEKIIPHYDHYVSGNFISRPKAYIIPQGWWKAIELLKKNKVEMFPLKKDTVIAVEIYKIVSYKSSQRQYETHHPNSEIITESTTDVVKFRKGDWYIPMNQAANRFLIEVLEPTAEDSYFAWNFFDAILGQKEGFSAYAFEDIAAAYLKNNLTLKSKLADKILADSAFAKNGSAQLNFVYQNSPWAEPGLLRYPVYRLK